MRRGGCLTQAKNTVIFGPSNKRRKAGEGWKRSQLQHISARLVPLSAVCRSPVKAFPGSRKQTGFAEGERGSRWCILCFMIQREARKRVVCPQLCSQYSDQLSSLATQQAGMCLRDVWPPFFSTSLPPLPLRSVTHRRGIPAGMPLLLPSSNVPRHLGCVPLRGEDKKESPRARGTKKECRKGKRLARWGENEMSFHVRSLSFWCTHQNNLRPTAASPGG